LLSHFGSPFFYAIQSGPFTTESPDLQKKPSGKYLKVLPAQHQPNEVKGKKSHRPNNEKGN
jgi:hypothetical protein